MENSRLPHRTCLLLRTASDAAMRAAAEAARRRAAGEGLDILGLSTAAGVGILREIGCRRIIIQPRGGYLSPLFFLPRLLGRARSDFAVIPTPNPMQDYENAYRIAVLSSRSAYRHLEGEELLPLNLGTGGVLLRALASAGARSLP